MPLPNRAARTPVLLGRPSSSAIASKYEISDGGRFLSAGSITILSNWIQERGAIETPEDFPDTVELIREMREERDNQILEVAGFFPDTEKKGQQA